MWQEVISSELHFDRKIAIYRILENELINDD